MSFIPNILLAGPHPDHLLFLEQLVSSFQVQTLKAMSGSDAISILEQNECALAIMEVNMPDMDGYELVKQIRQVTHIGHVPVILIMDDYSDSQYFIESIENGLVDFITKPVIPMIVQSKVKIYLELYKQGLQLQTEIENRKQAESVLFQTEKDLAREKMKVENTDRLKSVFLSNMAHELRTPLNSIIGFSNLLKDKDITPELRITYSNYIHISGQSLLSQVNEIIDFSKLDADQLGISGHPVNVNEVIYELFKLYKTELNNRNKTQAEPEKGPLAQHSPAHDKIVFRSKNMEIPVNKKNELDRKQILVAEDEEINFYFLKEALRNDHVTIYWARNGQQAIELFNKYPGIDIVLMDIKMPIMDGYQAMSHIKNIRYVPVIAQTAYALNEDMERILNHGFEEYLTKPIDISLLRTIIEKYLNKDNVTTKITSIG